MASAFPNIPLTTSSDGPICIIVLGMAGSGKTTFVQKLACHLAKSTAQIPFTINLDPAVHHVPYPTNIDIREKVNYKNVMKQYGLGPNGAIMTSLNLFATQFDGVISILQKDASKASHVIIDTPGQIEVFTWSASGSIITEALASGFPTVVVYVMDTVRSNQPTTFMSNMLYACSILYKTKLPFIVVLNKTDIMDCSFAIEWMHDFEAFQDALNDSADGETFMASMVHRMSLTLDEFYAQLQACGVSSITGEGLPEFLDLVAQAKKEYYEVYRPAVDRLKGQQEKRRQGQEPQTATGSQAMVIGLHEEEEEEECPTIEEDAPEEKTEDEEFNQFADLHVRGKFVPSESPDKK